MDGRCTGFRNNVEFDTFVGKKLQCPFASTFGWCGAGEADQMGFGTTVEDRLYRWREALFTFECGIETFFDEAFADVGDRIGVAVKLLADFLIGDTTVDRLIDGKQDIGVFDLGGTALAGRNEVRECGTLVSGQGYFINLLHRNCLVRK